MIETFLIDENYLRRLWERKTWEYTEFDFGMFEQLLAEKLGY